MKEDFLHFVWRFKKWKRTPLKTFQNQALDILHPGYYLQNAGPDFFHALLRIDSQKWAGNVEIHLKSSDWYVHHHETDANYDSVILHVVWEHDVAVYRNDASEIPVLELKHYVDASLVNKYRELLAAKTWINCEKQLHLLSQSTLSLWLERLYIERLEQKTMALEELLRQTTNNWEQVFFNALAKSFGLNSNGAAFEALFRTLPFSVLKKEQHDLEALEALLFGGSGLLNHPFEDTYPKHLKAKWLFLAHKYQLPITPNLAPQFFKHRPDNFPTIRLAQLAQLLHQKPLLFQQCVSVNSLLDLKGLFTIRASRYWDTHYTFDHATRSKPKYLSNDFIDLLILNCVVPVLFCYAKHKGIHNSELLLEFVGKIKSERNSTIDKFQQLGLQSHSSLHSQAFMHLKNNYCNQNKCLHCEIGKNLINFTP